MDKNETCCVLSTEAFAGIDSFLWLWEDSSTSGASSLRFRTRGVCVCVFLPGRSVFFFFFLRVWQNYSRHSNEENINAGVSQEQASACNEHRVCLLSTFQKCWFVFLWVHVHVKPCVCRRNPSQWLSRPLRSRDIIMECLEADIKQLSPWRPELRDHFSHYTDHQTCRSSAHTHAHTHTQNFMRD